MWKLSQHRMFFTSSFRRMKVWHLDLSSPCMHLALFSLIRCFSDILIRMSESYKTVRNPTDGVTKFWWFCLKRFRNMIRMSEFLTFLSFCQTVRKGPDQANYVKTLTYPYNGIKLWHRDLFCSFHSGDNLLLVLKKLPITNCLLIT